MPLHEVGYRGWTGQKSQTISRWLVIATTGIQIAFRSSWLSRTLVLAWVPAILAGIGFFFYEQSIAVPEYRAGIAGIVRASGGSPELIQAVIRDPSTSRHEVWASIMLVFFRYPQSTLMLIVIGIVAPRLIAYDLRNRGYLLYFSRPIQLAGYILGKMLVICTFLALISTLPALMLYMIGLSLSPQVDVVLLTWDIPCRVLVASLVLMIPTASVALACSALTVETRYATFSWFALWIVGWVSYSVLWMGEMAAKGNVGPSRGRRRGPIDVNELQSNWELLSPFHTLGRVQQYVFGLYPADRAIWPYILVLVLVTFLSLWFVSRQLRARLRA